MVDFLMILILAFIFTHTGNIFNKIAEKIGDIEIKDDKKQEVIRMGIILKLLVIAGVIAWADGKIHNKTK